MCEFKHLLGKMPDNQIAQQFGISRERVRQYRVKFDIPKFVKQPVKKVLKVHTGVNWTPEMLNNLGKISDRNFANKYKINQQAVHKKRRSLNILPFAKHSRWNPRIDWTDELDSLLGKDSDVHIARQLNTDPYIVYERRRKLNIPSYKR